MAKIITKGGLCSTRNKPMGFQFIDVGGKYELSGSYGASVNGVVAGSDKLTSEALVADAYLAKGCKLCGNKYAYICPACDAVVCCDGNAKSNVACPSCGSTLNISAASGKSLPNVTLVNKAAFKVNRGDTVENGPYTKWAGVSKIEGVASDRFGNAQGSQYDLARDGAFNGYTVILVIQYHEPGKYEEPIEALKRKGFDVKVINSPAKFGDPSLQSLLKTKNSQLWFISTSKAILSQSDIQSIKDYYMQGNGVYIWGDNAPFFADANRILQSIFGSSVQLAGDDYGDKVLGIRQSAGESGIIADHPISTGIVNFYEGITISTVALGNAVKPLVYNSSKRVVTAFSDKDGRRIMIDGGFTRLYSEFWNTAGTERLIVNAAAWLANIERFGYHPQK